MQKLGIWSWHGYTIPNIKTGATSITTLGRRSSRGFEFGTEDKRRRDLGLSLFKLLDASVDATVEMGSKVVRAWYGELSSDLRTRAEAACLYKLTTGDVILSDSEAFEFDSEH
jgi:hypothetical protein